MANNQESKQREAEAKRRLIERARGELRELVGKVPPSHSTWSYQRAVAFKACVEKAASVLKSERTTVERAQMAASELAGFFK